MTRLNLALVVLGVLAFAASLLAGRVWLPPTALLDVFHQPDSLAAMIVADIRLPRTVLALMVGAVLGLAGAVLQGFTRNPLAEPALLGMLVQEMLVIQEVLAPLVAGAVVVLTEIKLGSMV